MATPKINFAQWLVDHMDDLHNEVIRDIKPMEHLECGIFEFMEIPATGITQFHTPYFEQTVRIKRHSIPCIERFKTVYPDVNTAWQLIGN